MAEKYEWKEVTLGWSAPRDEIKGKAAQLGLTEDEYLAALTRAADGVPVDRLGPLRS